MPSGDASKMFVEYAIVMSRVEVLWYGGGNGH
jgi:hypothetical protein